MDGRCLLHDGRKSNAPRVTAQEQQLETHVTRGWDERKPARHRGTVVC